MTANSTERPADDRGPVTAPAAAAQAAEALTVARSMADLVSDPATRVAALASVAAGWRDLALALATHQGLTPPRDVDAEPETGRRRGR